MLVAEAMTNHPITLPPTTTATKAAAAMRDNDVGDVLVCERDGTLVGIVTDRDLVVRMAAEGKKAAKLKDIASDDLVTIGPMEPLEVAAELMRDHAIRRLPVVDEEKKPVGVLSFGDVARRLDPTSAVAQISQAPPNN